MSSRNNHYVPRWYQEGFFEPGRNTLAYLDLTPPSHALPDGRTLPGRSRFESPTSRCFVQRDLYSTFFGTAVNDEIERRLFGTIDTSGAPAMKAFIGADPREWHRHFETLFTYIDIQKVRTPKGLDWLRAQYPALTQNELMWEMQGIRMMNCTIWTEGVREIVSAEDSDLKFIVSDHPVTVYNHAMPFDASGCAYPQDPSIALKGTQTIFPLNRDFCLILTNLEHARAPDANPLEKRTHARNYRSSLVRTDAFIRTRKLSEAQVRQINWVLKARARRYVAAGRAEWLYPEEQGAPAWRDIAATLRPPEDGLWHFGGEVYAKLADGRVHYQDEFGRTEPQHELLKKTVPSTLRLNDPCGCGSARPYGLCCEAIPSHLRPSWTELSIRERNLALLRAAISIFGLDQGKTWTDVRRDMTDDQIRKIYEVYAAFWPLETDLLQLLPKPDGRPRAVYTGLLHPKSIAEFAIGSGLYFGELIIEHPFANARMLRKEYSPIENPQVYRAEILKTLLLFLTMMPLVEVGLVSLVPDPCTFDSHLREQMMHLARDRTAGLDVSSWKSDRSYQLIEEDARRTFLLAPPADLMAQLKRLSPELDDTALGEVLKAFDHMKAQDPLAVLQPDSLTCGERGGQLTMMRLAPNFEMAMYLAQATGSCIVTDSPQRWAELNQALMRRGTIPDAGLPHLARAISQATLALPQDERDIIRLGLGGDLAPYPALMSNVARYLRGLEHRGRRPNFEAQLLARFAKTKPIQDELGRSGAPMTQFRMQAALPDRGLLDNSVNRLLLMSSSEHHWASVPMAFFLQSAIAGPAG